MILFFSILIWLLAVAAIIIVGVAKEREASVERWQEADLSAEARHLLGLAGYPMGPRRVWIVEEGAQFA